jgi:hypothetical protein
MKTGKYLIQGDRLNSGDVRVEVIYPGGMATPLPDRLDLVNHSPTGFEWGYRGSGPAQLALAICSFHLEDDSLAVKIHQAFKDKVLCGLPSSWSLTSNYIDLMIREVLSHASA